jgi:predicted Ser/Thr protein kinase
MSKKDQTKRKKNTRRARTLVERVETIFKFIDAQPGPFPKSEFRRIRLNPKAAESWVRLIEYIQSQPMIKVTRMGTSTYIEKIENRYLSMMRKRILNPKLSLKERNDAMRDYINALQTLEIIEDGRIKKNDEL